MRENRKAEDEQGKHVRLSRAQVREDGNAEIAAMDVMGRRRPGGKPVGQGQGWTICALATQPEMPALFVWPV